MRAASAVEGVHSRNRKERRMSEHSTAVDQGIGGETDQVDVAVIGDGNTFKGPVVATPTNIDVDVDLNVDLNVDFVGNGESVRQEIDQDINQDTDQTAGAVIGGGNTFEGPVVITPTNIDVDVGYNVGANFAVVSGDGDVDQEIDQSLIQDTDQRTEVVIGEETTLEGPLLVDATNINRDQAGSIAINDIFYV
jgi:hypothetical protein